MSPPRPSPARRPASPKAPVDQKGIQSVEIGMRLLDAIVRLGGTASLKEASRLAGLSASKAHRYLVSLARSQMLIRGAGGLSYELGPAALRMGLSALGRLDAVTVATETASHLVDTVGHSVIVAIWNEAGPVIVRWINGSAPVYTTMGVGSTLPAILSATGRVFLAHLPKTATKHVVARQLRELKSRGRVIAAVELGRSLDEVRERGHAVLAGDFIPGLSAAAAAVLDAHGDAAAVIALIGGLDGFDDASIDALVSHARTASERLGWSASA